MNHRPFQNHPSAEQLQALLDGELPRKAARPLEEHLASCAECAGEVDGLRVLFRELEDLPRLVPLEGFSDRVLQNVAPPVSRPLAARIRGRIADLLPGRWGHPSATSVQDFVEGLLPAPDAARMSAHVDGCAACGRQAISWRNVLGRLDALGHVEPPEGFAVRVMERRALEAALGTLGHHAPSEGFAARVMAQVAVPSEARAPVRRPVAVWDRLAAAARRLVPETRQAWAALSGAAVTPVVTAGLMAYAVFSHPTLTPGALVSFAWWKASDLAALAWSASAGTLLESAGAFQVVSAFQSIVSSPAALAAGFVVFSVCTVVALWVLYRNLFASPSGNGRYAHASL